MAKTGVVLLPGAAAKQAKASPVRENRARARKFGACRPRMTKADVTAMAVIWRKDVTSLRRGPLLSAREVCTCAWCVAAKITEHRRAPPISARKLRSDCLRQPQSCRAEPLPPRPCRAQIRPCLRQVLPCHLRFEGGRAVTAPSEGQGVPEVPPRTPCSWRSFAAWRD